jgi:hypothetical protein
MADVDGTRNVVGTGIMERGPYIDILFTVAGADTFLANTILAVDSVSLKAVPYVKGGVTNENGIGRLMLTSELVTTGAGDVSIRAMETGQIQTSTAVIHADGDASNIDNAVKMQLKGEGLVLTDTVKLGTADN